MKTFVNVNPRDVRHALTVVRQTRQDGRTAAFTGGGSDVLQLMKERIVTPDVLINLKAIGGLDQVKSKSGGLTIGGLTTLSAVARQATGTPWNGYEFFRLKASAGRGE